MEIGRQIKKYRLEMKLSQEELADKEGTESSQINVLSVNHG